MKYVWMVVTLNNDGTGPNIELFETEEKANNYAYVERKDAWSNVIKKEVK